MFDKKVLIFMAAAALGGSVALAQQPAANAPAQTTTQAPPLTYIPDGGQPHYLKAETPEQRQKRLGTTEDPGPNPDPKQHFWRFGQSYHIDKYDLRWASFADVDPGSVRPFAFVNAENEVYQINDKFVWVWAKDPSPQDLQPPPPPPRYSEAQLKYFETMRAEFYDLTPKASDKTIHFEDSSEGLPASGSWRNGLAVADMNGDGCPDIIVPPERQGNGVPAIFLGDCKGHWKFWQGVQWPKRIDYGSVVAADFNKDGHMDLAFAVHQSGVVVMLGDGKGHFTLSNKGIEQDFATRRLVVADVDHDGYPDLVAINEGISFAARPEPHIRVYLNRDKGTSWDAVDLAGPQVPVSGDWLTVADLKGERYPDFIASTIFMNSNATIFLSNGKAQWKPLDASGYLLPYLGYYYANAAGKISSKKRDDALLSYIRYWPSDLDPRSMPDPPLKTIVGIDRVSFAGKEPVRTPVVRWGGTRPILGLAVGDFDGNGTTDIAYTRFDPRELVILLGDGKGGFTRAKVEGIKLPPNTNYDITVADVNGDGKPDLIIMYEANGAGSAFAPRDGSIHVYLNRGVVRAEREAK